MPNTSWLFWALLSAIFAAMTAVFTKLGVNTINSDFATFIRTCVILVLVTVIAHATKQFQPISSISGKGLTFLVLSGLATGASWLCYFRAMNLGQASGSTNRQIECGSGRSVQRDVIRGTTKHYKLVWDHSDHSWSDSSLMAELTPAYADKNSWL